MATRQVWHGTEKCAVNGAKIPRNNRGVGQSCPFCGNTVGAYFRIAPTEASPQASSPETQLANLKRLHDNGLITDAEYAQRRDPLLDRAVEADPTEPPSTTPAPAAPITDVEGKRSSLPWVLGVVGVGLIVVVVVVAALNSDGDSSQPAASLSCVEYLQAELLLLVDISEDIDLLAVTLEAANVGAISLDDASDVLSTLSRRFAQAEQNWRSLGDPPAGLERNHSLMTQAFARYETATAMAATAIRDRNQVRADIAASELDKALGLVVDASGAMSDFSC